MIPFWKKRRAAELQDLIQRYLRGQALPPRVSPAMRRMLAAIDLIQRAHGIWPQRKSDQLEQKLREIAREQRPLRRRSRSLPPNGPRLLTIKTLPTSPSPPPAAPTRKLPTARLWRRPLVVAASIILALFTLILVHATAVSLPGDLLFPIKAASRAVPASLSSNPATKASNQIGVLQDTIDEMNQEVAQHQNTDHLNQALANLKQQANNARAAVNAITDGAQHTQAIQQLDGVMGHGRTALLRLLALNRLDWHLRLAATRQLSDMGGIVLILQAVNVALHGDHQIITIQGLNFTSMLQLVLNGKLADSPVMVEGDQATVDLPLLSFDSLEIGILAPDGEAAATSMVMNNQDTSPTPIMTPTPTPRGHRGKPTPSPLPTPSPGHHG